MPAPLEYKSDYPQKIIKFAKQADLGLSTAGIAEALDVSERRLFTWAREREEFRDALEVCQTIRNAKLFGKIDKHLVTHEEFVKVYDKAILKLLEMGSYGKGFSVIKGVTDEFEAMQLVNDAAARGEITVDSAESMGKFLSSKSAIRRDTKDRELLHQALDKLGIEH